MKDFRGVGSVILMWLVIEFISVEVRGVEGWDSLVGTGLSSRLLVFTGRAVR